MLRRTCAIGTADVVIRSHIASDRGVPPFRRRRIMPRISNNEMPKGWRVVSNLASERSIADEVMEVTVLHDSDVFEQFVSNIYDALTERFGCAHGGALMPITVEDLTRYAYTAVRARVARVNSERVAIDGRNWQVRCDDTWALPTPLAFIIAGIGRVTLEMPVITIVPKWNEEHDIHVLSYEDWSLISRRLRAIEADKANEITLAHAIEGGKQGDETLMALVPVRDAVGRVTEIRSQGVFDPVAAAAYLIAGLEPSALDTAALPQHPLMLPPRYIQAAIVLQYLHRLAEASVE